MCARGCSHTWLEGTDKIHGGVGRWGGNSICLLSPKLNFKSLIYQGKALKATQTEMRTLVNTIPPVVALLWNRSRKREKKLSSI
jgi:hypothetical protein